MVKYDTELLIDAIMREYKCNREEALKLMNYTNDLDDELQNVVDAWINDGTILDISVNDVNIEYIMNKMQTSFLAALVHMNRFILNPSETERFKKLRPMNRDVNPPGGE